VIAGGEDAEGTFSCGGWQLADGSWIGLIDGEAPCEPRQIASDDDDEAILDLFGGAFTIESFRDALGLEVEIAGAGEREVAGLRGECFEIKDETGSGTLCVAVEEGVVLSMDWREEDDTGLLELQEVSYNVSDEDLARPTFESAGGAREELSATAWLGPGGRCDPPDEAFPFEPTAIAVDSAGDVWVGTSLGYVFVLTPETCALRSIQLPGSLSGSAVGMATSGDGRVVVSFVGGEVLELARDGTMTELLARTPDAQAFVNSVSSPAFFPDGSVAIARNEGEQVVLYRIAGGQTTEVQRWDGRSLILELLTVPGAGVALPDPGRLVEVHVSVDGTLTETAFSAGVFAGFTRCGAYSSADVRWEVSTGALLRSERSGEGAHFRMASAPAPTGLGCSDAALDAAGNLWFIVEPEEGPGVVYSVPLPE
jgi:hypothetical protein